MSVSSDGHARAKHRRAGANALASVVERMEWEASRITGDARASASVR
jgi:hypothetical protein